VQAPSIIHHLTGPTSAAIVSLVPFGALRRSALLLGSAGQWYSACPLHRWVGNLLPMTLIERGALKLNLQPVDIQDVIDTVI
jgi:K+-sensing histidine kinase KdpD